MGTKLAWTTLWVTLSTDHRAYLLQISLEIMKTHFRFVFSLQNWSYGLVWSDLLLLSSVIETMSPLMDIWYTSGQKSFPLCVFILSYFAWNLLPSKDMTWEFYYSVICTLYCNKTRVLYLGNKFYAKYDSIKTQRGKDFCPEVYHMSIRELMISITLDRRK